MLNVFITVDVEIWCADQESLDESFPDAFRRYVYGPTPAGDFGLPYTLRLLSDHGLAGVFFVEPLFSCRFGAEPLQEVVGLIREAGQEIQLHLHTEWVRDSKIPLLPDESKDGQHLFQFSSDEQRTLITKGHALLRDAGGGIANAFRAGSFGFNIATLDALNDLGFAFDSSYNAILFGLDSGFMPGEVVCQPSRYRALA